jgi:phosphomannomutase/phosphoglucomutase
MDGLAKLLLSLGSKGISLVTIGVSCFVVVMGFLWQQQSSNQEFESVQIDYQKKIAMMAEEFTLARINSVQAQMESIAQSRQVSGSLSFNDSSLIELQQQDLLSYFPSARSLCLISAEVDEVTTNGCMPISFATLNSLRQAKKDGIAQIGLIKQGSDEAYLLLAQRISNTSGSVVGVLVVTLTADVVPSLLYQSADFKGYIELQQGSKNITVLASQGNKSNKQGKALFINEIPNTYWHLAYWPEKPLSQALSIVILGAILAVMVLMWLLLEGVKAYIVKRDVSIIKSQLADLKSGALKPRYHVTLQPFNKLVTEILALGRENYHNTAKKGATAESISKKIEEVENIVREPSHAVAVKEIINIDPTIFRMNDIRGIVGQNLDEHVFKALGQAVGSEAIEQGISQLIVGRDARLSSPGLGKAVINGILASGCDVIDIGEVPTPVMYFACEHFKTQSGVMLTGSHNPPDYNGLKIVMAGQPLAQKDLQQLHQRILHDELKSGKGDISEESISYEYVSRIVGDIKIGRPLKVVIDCGNGIAGSIAPALFKAIGCEVVELFCEVDGKFPNHHPNPSQPENLRDLSQAVQEHDAELGMAFDGDGDRLGVVDGNGTAIFPDRLLMLFAQDILSRVAGATILYDVKCTSLLAGEIASAGGKPIMVKSGHSLIKTKMQEVDAQLAGEFSGHFFIKERWYGFDDALYAACRLLEVLSNDSLSRKATEVFTALPSRKSTPEILVGMAEGESTSFMRQLAGEGQFEGADLSILDGIRAEYKNGWGLVRASNTMPGLTLRFEADSAEELQDIQQRFKAQMLQIKPTLKLLF